MKSIGFHAEAKTEYDAAITWYENEVSDLGTQFQDHVEAAKAKIAQNPAFYPINEDFDCRECLLQRFPYSIFYIERGERIWIMAVAHLARKPGYWLHRIADIRYQDV